MEDSAVWLLPEGQVGRIKDLQIDLLNLELAWLGLLAALFEKLGFAVLSCDDRQGYRPKPDLTIEENGETVVVELKLYRSERVPLALMRNAFAQLDAMAGMAGAQRGILIIPQRLAESHYLALRLEQYELWDLDRLVREAKPFPDIAADLSELLRALRIGAEHPPEGSPAIAEFGDTAAELPPLGAGSALAKQLAALPPGKKDGAAQKFEKLCEEALRLLFAKDFVGWRSQSEIEQGFQRVDVIARLQPTHSAFWATIAADFRTRYVVFEFKNYTDPITQDQVYTTEKYLFTSALRSVAIIIAKNGVSKSAERAMHGALREQGKLILCLSMTEFCGLLKGFDVGDNPEELLIHKVDDILMTMGR